MQYVLILGLLLIESTLLTLVGGSIGFGAVYGILWGARSLIEKNFGFYVPLQAPTELEWMFLGLLFGAGFLTGFIPALRAYRNTLSDGLTQRI